MTATQRARTARVNVKWREITDFETEVDVDPLREALLSWIKPDAPHYHATVEKIETASAEELAEIAGDYTGAVTHLIIEGETLSTEDHGSSIELTEITTKPAPTSNLEPPPRSTPGFPDTTPYPGAENTTTLEFEDVDWDASTPGLVPTPPGQ